MPNQKITNFENFTNNFDTLDSNSIVSEDLKEQLLDIIPKFFNYEEEGSKLSFDVLVFKDIEVIRKKLSTYLFQEVVTIDNSKLNLKKQIKSLAPFSVNGWSVFISQEGENFVVGIYKDFTSIGSLDISEILKGSYILIKKIDNEILEFSNGLEHLYLHLSIVKKDISYNRVEQINSLVKKITDGISEDENKAQFQKNLHNLFAYSLEKSHGCIIVVQEADKDIDEFFKNGIFFEKPIDLYDEYLNYLKDCSPSNDKVQRHYSITGILSVAINIDGIVMIDSKARLLAYNVFIDNDKTSVDTSVVSGGARKRATHSIIHTKPKGVLGVYFQSHDGESEFKELVDEQ